MSDGPNKQSVGDPRRVATAGQTFSTLSQMSTDDRRIDAVSGEPAATRDSVARPATSAKRSNGSIDPREETVAKRAAPRSKAPAAKAPAAKSPTSPARPPKKKVPAARVEPALPAPEPAPPLSTAAAILLAPIPLPPIPLPPIQLQPDRTEVDPAPDTAPVSWVPTTFEPVLFDAAVQDPTGEHVPPDGALAQGSRSTRVSPGGRRPRPRVRRVTRVVRHVDPWSVFKIALCFSAVLYGICLTAGVLLWNVAYTTGTVDNLEKFFESFGWSSFHFKGGQLYHNAWIIGLFIALGLTGLALLSATLFNLITDLVGGVRVTVLEEEVIERTPTASTPLLRRRRTPSSGAATGESPAGFDDSVDKAG